MKNIQKILLTLTFAFLPFFSSLSLSPPPDPALFLIEPTSAGCDWKLVYFPRSLTKILHQTPSCPDEIIWDQKTGDTYYLLFSPKPSLYKMPQGDKPTPVLLAELPPLSELNQNPVWVLSEKGTLRLALIEEISEKNITKKGEKSFVSYKGKVLETDRFLNVGTPAVITVLELNSQGKWEILALEPTSIEAGDAPGFLVVEKWMKIKENSISLNESIQKESAVGWKECASVQEKNCQDAKFAQEKMKDPKISSLPKLKEADEVAYLRLNNKEGLLVPLMYGDSGHFATPVYYCSNDCQITQAIEYSTQDTIGLSFSITTLDYAYLLISGEYLGNSPVVFKMRDLKTVFYTNPKAEKSFWFKF